MAFQEALWSIYFICSLGAMQGGIISLSLTALLCVGILPKPSIWADPVRFFTTGSAVTIWCQGSQPAQGFRLYREGSLYDETANLQNSRNWSASFNITDMDRDHAGKFQCDYHRPGDASQPSDPLLLVLTGAYSPPQLSVNPSRLVASGEKGSLTCLSKGSFHTFHLLKEGTDHMALQKGAQFSASLTQAIFPLDPVREPLSSPIPSLGPQITELSQFPKDPTGVHRKPSLTASPHSPVMVGANLTLQCHSQDGFDKFALARHWPSSGLQLLAVQPSPNFILTRVFSAQGGQYWCYGGYGHSYEWSAPSEALDILLAGQNLTLQCRSSHWFDIAYWFKENINNPLQPIHSESQTGSFQANFTISPATSAHEGTYRCYMAYSKYLLSQPSDPLELVLSEIDWGEEDTM
ncbi:leukocyte immunoglobulin-like receptor subfamily A member 6 [Tenrec ecaudatus]|uniref:leukocyte immunoglobulin-like receptor subfamily A member 6 n=1 Tax=Tenrec ecaudatus TaxID=94439 RepID=UPI003F5933A3